MTRAKLISWAVVVIGMLLIVSVASLIGGHGVSVQYCRPIHQVSGVLLLIGCSVHLSLHWNWIRSVLIHPPTSLARNARMKRSIVIWLLCLILLCGLTGVMNWLTQEDFPDHFPHDWNGLHHICGIAVIILMIVHLALHWNWIKHTFIPLSIE